MPCEITKSEDGQITTIKCSRGSSQKRCFYCGRPAPKLCDFKFTVKVGKLAGKTWKTCDKPLCTTCAVHQEPDTDYCEPHARLMGIER
jgi:hypothetical protein